MDHPGLLDDIAQAISALTAKVHECVVMGRPTDAVDYSAALKSTSDAYWALCPQDEE